jgi:acylphosphatase
MASVTPIDIERREVIWSGRVQGVGFRYTVVRLVRGRPLTGFLRNEPDGTVKMVVEGEAAEIDNFVAAIGAEFQHYIASCQSRRRPATGKFRGFGIEH